MTESVIAGVISLIGTIIGVLGGFYVTNKLVVFRIERLEEAIKETNKLVDRVYKLEQHNTVQDHRIETLEDEQNRIITDIRDMKRGN